MATDNGFLPSGTRLHGGKYTIKRVLGQGAMGITYAASVRVELGGNLGNISTETEVAIKEFYLKNDCQRSRTTSNVVVPNSNNTQQVFHYRQNFIKEARKIAGLHHPNIVHVLEVFDENNTSYYVMEMLGGGSIRDFLERYGALDEKSTLKIALEVASALDYMHSTAHLCHYDLKPANIMLDTLGNAKVIDFGIAKHYDENGKETSTTPPGLTKGFAPIEQYGSISGFSPKSDVYSLGATMYAMLTGETPPEPMVWLNGSAFREKPRNVSEETWNIVRKAMATASMNRPGMDEIVGMISAHNPSLTPPKPTPVPPKSKQKSKPTPKPNPKSKSNNTLFIVLLVIAGIIVGFVLTIAACFMLVAADDSTGSYNSDTYETPVQVVDEPTEKDYVYTE